MQDERLVDNINSVKDTINTTKSELNVSINKSYDNAVKYTNKVHQETLQLIKEYDNKVR